jgi:hypothetical protein
MAAPTCWTIGAGGNGHSYEATYVPGGTTFDNAESGALGAGGYLATIHSTAENNFCYNLVSDSQYWYQDSFNNGIGPWLGGWQPPPRTDEPAGGWAWKPTGEAWTYTNWGQDEPNNYDGIEHWLHFFGYRTLKAPTWNDLPNFQGPKGYVTEFEPGLSASNVNFGYVRVGTSANGNLTVTNTDTHNTQLGGTIGPAPGASDFAPQAGPLGFTLGSAESAYRTFTYTPGQRVPDSALVSITSNVGNVTRTLSGRGVGPVFDSRPVPGSTLDFGEVRVGEVAKQALIISNLTTDPNLDDLTDLTLLSTQIIGDSPDCFKLAGFTPGMVLAKSELVTLAVEFHAHGPLGDKSAKLLIETDQNAPFGRPGDTFTFRLAGQAVPEPGSLALAMAAVFGAAGLLCRRRGCTARKRTGCAIPSQERD